jgi:hypothetical protein
VNDLVEFRTADDQEYEEIVEEYEEKIFVSEEFQESSVTDTTDLAPAQGKSRYINLILQQDHVVALLRFDSSVGNLSLLTTGNYYNHKSHNKMVERKW